MPYIDHEQLRPHNFAVLARDVEERLTPNATQRTTLIVAGCYIILIAALWHIRVLSWIIYPFKLLTVGFHEMSHALAGVLTCAHIDSIELDPDEGGATKMSGGIPCITLPAGYLGSSFIGAALIACGFDTNASKIACLVVVAFWGVTMFWARKSWINWMLFAGLGGLIIACWFIAESVALRFLVLFIGVMSTLYVLWDIIDDTIARKVNSSDAERYHDICQCCPGRVWGVIWLFIAFIFFALGVLIGLAAFKESSTEQAEASSHFLPSPVR